MRPMLRPGLRLLEGGPGSACLVDGDSVVPLDRASARLLVPLDGLADEPTTIGYPDDDPAVRETWARLRESGVLMDAQSALHLTADLAPAHRQRAFGDILALLADDPARAEERWRRRRRAVVEVLAGGELSATMLELLCGGGIGTLVLTGVDSDCTDRLRADFPDTRLLHRRDTSADVAVVGTDREPPSDELDRLVRGHVPHLVAGLRGRSAVVGPFVVPGATACLRCVDLARADAQPLWPTVREQLSRTAPPHPMGAPRASSIVTLGAALAAAEVLAYVDGRVPETVNRSLVCTLSRPVPRAHQWTPRPDCGCMWLSS
ncbi:MAG: hypothetical protein GEU93_01715 [Propionibacteriales bacterium]|nr:hypothetical protein [Propionibacteriales bacterium]